MEASEEAWPCLHLHFRLLASRVWEWISFVLSHSVCGFWHSSPRKLKQCAKGLQPQGPEGSKQNSGWHMVSEDVQEPVSEMEGQEARQHGCQQHYHREYWEGITDFSFSGIWGGPFDWLPEQLIFRYSGTVRFPNSQSLLLFVTLYFPKVAKTRALISLALRNLVIPPSCGDIKNFPPLKSGQVIVSFELTLCGKSGAVQIKT